MKRKLFTRIALWLLLTAIGSAFNVAQATCSAYGCVMAGPRLASVDSTRGELLNALLGTLTGSTVSVTAADWNTLAAGEVNVANLVAALGTSISPNDPLTTDVTLAQLINAAAQATVGANSSTVATKLGTVATALSTPTSKIKLGELIVMDGTAANTTINALDLVTGAVQLFNQKNVVTTTAPITIALPNIAGLTNRVTVATILAQVVEPAVYVCSNGTTQFHTASIRVKLTLTITAANVDATALLTLGISGLNTPTLQVGGTMSLYVEVGRTTGTLDSIDAIYSAMNLRARPGVADLYLGTIADATFFNRGRGTLSVADFGYATIGFVGIKITQTLIVTLTIDLGANVGVRSYARGVNPSNTNLTFNPPYPQTQTVYTGAGVVGTLLGDLAANTQIDISLNVLGLLIPIAGLEATVEAALKALVADALAPILTNVLDKAVTPVLDTLGVRLGEAVISAYGVYSVCTVSGNVYSDVNHNAMKDSTEVGTGLTLYAKLISPSTPTKTTQVATVNASTGAYSFTGVVTASYTVLIDTNNTTTDVTATVPAAWFPTEAPTFTRPLSVTYVEVPNQNFGLFNGSKLSGLVFTDNGIGGGTAHNIVRDGGETTTIDIVVKATNNAGSTTYDTTSTGDGGTYVLWIPASAGATVVKIVETNFAATVSIGANVGNSSGTYTLGTDTVAFTNTVGTTYTGVNFADVPANRFEPDGEQTILPGAVAFYRHTYVAGTSGQVTFAPSAPATTGWAHLVYRDTNCNGVLDSGELILTGATATTATQSLCLIVKVTSATNAPYGTKYPLSLGASFSYSSSSLTDSQTRKDLTIAGTPSDAGLKLTKIVNRDTATSGDALIYTINYLNAGNNGLTTMKIFDSTPSYTIFVSAACGSAPSGVTCNVTTQPSGGSTGNVTWTFSGTVPSGASGSVTFTVTVQ